MVNWSYRGMLGSSPGSSRMKTNHVSLCLIAAAFFSSLPVTASAMGWQGKADCQSYKGKCYARFHCFF
jgi:hypothetical protein